MTQLRKKMLEEIQRRNYSHRTARTYVRIVRDFAEYFHQPPDKLGPEQIRQYQAHLFQAKKLAPATVSQYVSALRFLFVKTLRRHFLAEYIPFPKSRKRLPIVLSPEEVTRLIDAACNLYHRTLLMTLYSTAVRRAEHAVRFGPVLCCWWFYWNGANGADKNNHGGVDFLSWWLNQIYWLDQINGARSLDVFDIHAYADGGPTNGFNDQQLRAATAKVARYYWDPATVNPDTNNTYTTSEEPSPGIPFHTARFKAMVDAIYPGTPLAYTEWSAGFAPNSGWDFSTALADADTYGAFGREGLGFASRWGGPSAGDPNYQAVKLYTNYDGVHHQFGTLSISAQHNANPDLFSCYAALDSTGTTMTIMVLNKDDSNSANVTFNLNGFSASTYTAYTLSSTSSSAIQASGLQAWSATQTFAPYGITLLVVSGTESPKPASEWYLNPDDLMIPASGAGTINPQITSGTAQVTLTSAVFDAYEGASACNGSLTLTDPAITTTKSAAITINAGSFPGFCHYTVTGNDGTTTQTEGGWIVVGYPPASLAVTSGNNQSGTAGTALPQLLTLTLAPGQSGGGAAGASLFFTTTAGSLQNVQVGSEQVFNGSKVIAVTSSSGVASVTLTLPGTPRTVQVTAEGPYALGHPVVTFTETAQ